MKFDDGFIVISLRRAQLTSPSVSHTNDDGTVFTDDLFLCEARYQELSYNRDILVDVRIKGNEKSSTLDNVLIASYPVMVKRDACCLKKLSKVEKPCVREEEYDNGRYFII